MKIEEASFVISAVDSRDYPKDGFPDVAFIGRSNVGKSSLINSLTSSKSLARTSNTPGRTQQINFFKINRKLYFVDLPGYGYAKVSQKQREMLRKIISNYLSYRETFVLTILLIDSRHLPTESDLQAKSWLEEQSRPFLVVLTKSDKLSSNELRNQVTKIRTALGTDQVIPYSAVTGFGKDQLWKSILEWINTHHDSKEKSKMTSSI
ncbi:MAG: YihA family ribosome biogenesis GTP-binding protein [Blastocatellia bacterium]|nr:YihA family ribosome biogenesis GTP-binding protein [Blastocatellia bacterium]